MADEPLIFLSYIHSARPVVEAVIGALKARDLPYWNYGERLMPGQNWYEELRRAITRANPMVLFLSRWSDMDDDAIKDVQVAMAARVPIVPVRTDDSALVPRNLAANQIFRLKGPDDAEGIRALVDMVERIYRSPPDTPRLEDKAVEDLAESLAVQARGGQPGAPAAEEGTAGSIFIVHGHDEEFLRDVEGYIRWLNIEPIILKDLGGPARSLNQKFFDIAGAAKNALVLISGDDFGAARLQYEADQVGERALQFRARQNVVLELGYFYGLLGWENVFVLESHPPRVFPNFERPSDLNGVVFVRYDDSGKWRVELCKHLASHGFTLPPSVDQGLR